MSDSSGSLDRLLVALDRYYPILVAAFCILALVGGWMAHAGYVAGDQTAEERTVATWTSDGEFTHAATVERDTLVFEAGERLEDRSLYFTSIAPVVEGTYVYRHAGDAEPAAVRTELQLVLRAVDRDGSGEYEH